MRKTRETFTYIQHQYYISLFLLGEFCGNYDNMNEVREAEYNLLYN